MIGRMIGNELGISNKKREVAAFLAETFCRGSRDMISILETLLDYELVTRPQLQPVVIGLSSSRSQEQICPSGSMATGGLVTFGLLGSLGLSM